MKIVTHVDEGIDEESPVVTVTIIATTMVTKDAKKGADVAVDRGLVTQAEPVIMVATDIEKMTILKALNAERVYTDLTDFTTRDKRQQTLIIYDRFN